MKEASSLVVLQSSLWAKSLEDWHDFYQVPFLKTIICNGMLILTFVSSDSTRCILVIIWQVVETEDRNTDQFLLSRNSIEINE